MGPYEIVLGAGGILSLGLYALRLRRRSLPALLALWGLLLGAALGILAAKAGYAALMFGRRGWERVIGFSPDQLSVVCGALGVCGGVALSRRLTRARVSAGTLLDLFAPCGALLLCFLRAGEYFLGNLGAGAYLDDAHPLARVPFGIQNEWGEWMAAVCTLEAACALIIALIFLFQREKGGWVCQQAALLLCLTQILCESLRNSGMRWGFVRVEQLLCAVIALGLILGACLKRRKDLPALRRFLPLIVSALCVAVLVGMEFALDKGLWWVTNKVFRLPAVVDVSHAPHNTEITYGIMILCLLGMAWMQRLAHGRRGGKGGNHG